MNENGRPHEKKSSHLHHYRGWSHRNIHALPVCSGVAGWLVEEKKDPGHKVVDLCEKANSRVQVKVLNLESGREMALLANRVLLATGHWFVERNDLRCFASPWPAGFLQSHIPEDAKVAIIGTGLSAIDAVLTLTAKGIFSDTASGELCYRPTEKTRHLTLYSRKGLLPSVRGRRGP
jgi:uncharacterized NAD(P)/FAD-binding protein YdhS